jgi:hypothetical protein
MLIGFWPFLPWLVCTLQALHHSNLDTLSLDSLIDFQLNIDVELSFLDSFRLAFSHMSYLLTCNLLNMVFEHFQDSFDLEDSINSFIQLHQLNSHVAINYIP